MFRKSIPGSCIHLRKSLVTYHEGLEVHRMAILVQQRCFAVSAFDLVEDIPHTQTCYHYRTHHTFDRIVHRLVVGQFEKFATGRFCLRQKRGPFVRTHLEIHKHSSSLICTTFIYIYMYTAAYLSTFSRWSRRTRLALVHVSSIKFGRYVVRWCIRIHWILVLAIVWRHVVLLLGNTSCRCVRLNFGEKKL